MEQEDKNKVEAILFTTGRFMELEEIAKVCGIGSVGYVKEILDALLQEYATKQGSLSIVQDGTKYKLNIKKEYGFLANKLVSSSEFDHPTTKTLAIIAYKQPIMQADVIKIRGNKAYEHIHVLKENGLVTAEKSGRTRILKLTAKFYDYFDIVDNELREKFVAKEQEVRQKIEVEKHVAEEKRVKKQEKRKAMVEEFLTSEVKKPVHQHQEAIKEDSEVVADVP